MTTRDVHLFVLDTLADWEPGFAIAHINRPAPGYPAKYQVRTVGLHKTPVRTLGGVTIVPDLSLAELAPAASAMLILPGADLWENTPAVTEPALAKAREFVAAGVPIAAICGATFGLARAGLLDERLHTSNDPGWLASSGYRGASCYRDQAVVDAGGVITASAMAPLEFARAILARLEVYPPAALEAWYALYKTREPQHFYAFVEALGLGGA